MEEIEQWEWEHPKNNLSWNETTDRMRLERQEQSVLDLEEILLNQQILLCNMKAELHTIAAQFCS